jgi:hypothetical protein
MRRLLAAILLTSAASLHAQQTKAEPRHTLVPYTAETSTVSVMVKTDGTKFPALKSTRIEARDSQGRRFTSTTPANGAHTFQIYDPLAGELLVWNSTLPLLKVLKFPNPVPARSSCWQATPEQMHYVANEPQIQVQRINCQPAERNNSVYCGRRPRATPDVPNNSPAAQPSFERCSADLSSSLSSGHTKVDDLGAQPILNREAYGCRETSNTADGTATREEWLIELGTERTRTDLVARITSDSPFPGIGRVTDTSEITSLKLAEPDPHSFQPPASYQRKTYEMVPCGTLQSQPSSTKPH